MQYTVFNILLRYWLVALVFMYCYYVFVIPWVNEFLYKDDTGPN